MEVNHNIEMLEKQVEFLKTIVASLVDMVDISNHPKLKPYEHIAAKYKVLPEMVERVDYLLNNIYITYEKVGVFPFGELHRELNYIHYDFSLSDNMKLGIFIQMFNEIVIEHQKINAEQFNEDTFEMLWKHILEGSLRISATA